MRVNIWFFLSQFVKCLHLTKKPRKEAGTRSQPGSLRNGYTSRHFANYHDVRKRWSKCMKRQRMLALRTCRNGIWTVYQLVGWVHRHVNGQTNTWDILNGIHEERHLRSRNRNWQCAQYWYGVILNELGHVGSRYQKRGWNDGAKIKGIPTRLSISWLATAE